MSAQEPAGPQAEHEGQSGIAGLQPVEDAIPTAKPTAAATPDADGVGSAPQPPATGQPSNRAARAAAGSSSSSEGGSSSDEEDGRGGPHAAPSGTGYISESESEEGQEGGEREEEEEDEEEDEAEVADLIAQMRAILSVDAEVGVQLAKPSVLSSFDLAGVSALIQSGRARRIICMCGAGISVSAGIPDFRSPGTGLYSRLQKYNLPYPHAVFEMSFFRKNPRPFFLLAKELFPGNYLPTPTHFFMKLLHDKGLLLRCFTQNIDSLEHQAGLPPDAVVPAHGNFDSARCIKCKRPHDVEHVRRAVFESDGNPAYCLKKSCGGLVKPDIVFFGENLPERFHVRAAADFPECDLLIVMGTSLVVHPFAGLINCVDETVPRLLINREKAGEVTPEMRAIGYRRGGFDFGKGNYRDALYLGDCDDGVRQLCSLLGWEGELDALIAEGRHDFHPQYAAPSEEAQQQAGVATWQ